MSDFIPAPDAGYDTWLLNFANFAEASGASLGLTPAQIPAMQTAQTDWHNTLVSKQTLHDSAMAANQNRTAVAARRSCRIPSVSRSTGDPFLPG